jgi:homoserine dehydrogenase
MSAVLEVAGADLAGPAPAAVRTIKVGVVGLGQVGQAVARLAGDTPRLRDAGLRFRIVGALVRDVDKQRRCARPPRLTSNPSAFLRGHYDVVVEALGTVEPARTIVSRALGRGIPVVTANKALVAAHGGELASLAARRGTTFRYEASALAGVPFLGALGARPLVSHVREFTAVVNGTSNFILSKLESERCAFDDALAQARALGLTEPDPSRDLDGRDAADKLALLAAIFGWGAIRPSQIEVHGIREVGPNDLAAAHTLGCTIKPVVHAAVTAAGVRAFVGPALVAARHPLGSLSGTLSGIQLSGHYIPDLFFSGPGAGPDITAATIVDDAVEAVSSVPSGPRVAVRQARTASVAEAPATGWFIRARFPGITPDSQTTAQLFERQNIRVTHVIEGTGDSRYLLAAACTRASLEAGLRSIAATHRIECVAWRVVGEVTPRR